jgi:hypothetical protein
MTETSVPEFILDHEAYIERVCAARDRARDLGVSAFDWVTRIKYLRVSGVDHDEAPFVALADFEEWARDEAEYARDVAMCARFEDMEDGRFERSGRG